MCVCFHAGMFMQRYSFPFYLKVKTSKSAEDCAEVIRNCYLCNSIHADFILMRRYLFFIAILCVCSASFATIPPGYYQAANGKKKAALKSALHEIIRVANVLSYGSGSGHTWEGFYNADRMANNQVRDRYSLEKFYFTSNSYSAPSGMNIEHSFPKSWWGGSKTQAYKDLHHLMPCESGINSSKSNYPMGEVQNVKVDNGCTKVGTGYGANGRSVSLWEPADEWKGDFARVYFYMATCYQDYTWSGSAALSLLENNTWPTLQSWAYDLYLDWCRQDPVDDIERARNEAVYQLQGNRNPFVDYPNLCEYVWGDSIAYAFNVDGSSTGGSTVVPDDNEEETIQDVLVESFETGIGSFSSIDVEGVASTIWAHNASYDCMVANAYNKGKVADAWLMSPTIDLTGYTSAELTFQHATGYHGSNSVEPFFHVCVSENYEGIPSEANWDVLSVTYPGAASSNYTSFVSSGVVDLTAYAGKKVHLAFRYIAKTSACYAWETKGVTLRGMMAADAIQPNFCSPVKDVEAVFTLGGTYVGNALPDARGVYVIRKNNKTYKVVKK